MRLGFSQHHRHTWVNYYASVPYKIFKNLKEAYKCFGG